MYCSGLVGLQIRKEAVLLLETVLSWRPFQAINEPSSQLHHFIMINESLILMQWKTNHLQQSPGKALVIMSLTPPTNWVILSN